MASGTRRDPLPVYCFKVTIGGFDTSFFKSVSGLKYETEVTPYAEGGQNRFTHQLVGATKWSNIVLKRGFAKDRAGWQLMEWREAWVNGQCERKSGEIIQLDTKLNEVCGWAFEAGWPCKWEVSEFDASKSELSIETLEIAHHGLKIVKK